MEGPGGYQLVGRTVPVWRRDAPTPWLLRQFDQLRFHLVKADELLVLRDAVRAGEIELSTEPTTFSLREHQAFLAANACSIDAFQATQRRAFDEERGRWEAAGER